MKQYDYPTAFSYWSAEESRAMERVLSSGRLTMGMETELFEEEFSYISTQRFSIIMESPDEPSQDATVV